MASCAVYRLRIMSIHCSGMIKIACFYPNMFFAYSKGINWLQCYFLDKNVNSILVLYYRTIKGSIYQSIRPHFIRLLSSLLQRKDQSFDSYTSFVKKKNTTTLKFTQHCNYLYYHLVVLSTSLLFFSFTHYIY